MAVGEALCGLPLKRLLTHKGFVDVGTTGDHIGSPLQKNHKPVKKHLQRSLSFCRGGFHIRPFHLKIHAYQWLLYRADMESAPTTTLVIHL